MPSAAQGPEGAIILAFESDPSETYSCPECEGPMTVVREHTRNGTHVVRHFSHIGDTCSYESKPHQDMKNYAAHTLQAQFPEASVRVEGQCGTKFADVLLTFPDPHPEWNLGICVECQYRNHGKNIPRTNHEYLSKGFSVLWVERTDFDGVELQLPNTKADPRVKTPWPDAVPSPLPKNIWGPDALRPSYEQGIHHGLEPVAVNVVRDLRRKHQRRAQKPRPYVPRLVQLWLKYGPHSRESFGRCPRCQKWVTTYESPTKTSILPHTRPILKGKSLAWTRYGKTPPLCLASWLEIGRPSSFSQTFNGQTPEDPRIPN